MPYLTPDDGGDLICRRFRLPGNWAYLFMGALTELMRAHNWEQHGTETPYDMVAEFTEIIEGYIEDCMAGEIWMGLTDFPPNVLPCDGSQYFVADYPELAAALGAAFQVPPDKFSVPDLRGRALVGSGQGAGLTNRVFGTTFGLEQVTLTQAQMPNHSHGYQFTATVPINGGIEAPASGAAAPTSQAVTATGGGQPHTNMQPSYAVNIGVWAK